MRRRQVQAAKGVHLIHDETHGPLRRGWSCRPLEGERGGGADERKGDDGAVEHCRWWVLVAIRKREMTRASKGL